MLACSLVTRTCLKNYKRFDFWHVQTADIGGTKPWKNNCSLIWKLFKFLMTLLAGLFEMRGCWHIGLRWAIVALWATCLVFYLFIYNSFFFFHHQPVFFFLFICLFYFLYFFLLLSSIHLINKLNLHMIHFHDYDIKAWCTYLIYKS